MPIPVVTRDLYEKLTEAFRSQPGDWNAACRSCGCDRRVAKRAWLGPKWRELPWAIPIQERLTKEAAEAANAAERIEDQRRAAALEQEEQARKLAEEAKDIDGKALRVMRKNLLGANIVFARILDGALKVADRLNTQLQSGKDARGRDILLDPMDAMKLLRQFTLSVQNLTNATSTLVTISRLQENLPTEILGFDVSNMTLEDVEEQHALAAKAIERARELGLVLHAGGKGAA